MLKDKVEWVIRKRKPTSTEITHHCGIFYTSTPGYRVQFRAQIDRLHGDIYFSVRIMPGIFDERLTWPCQQKFNIKLSHKMRVTGIEDWYVPSSQWRHVLSRAINKKDDVFSEWVGPFNISHYINANRLCLDIYLV